MFSHILWLHDLSDRAARCLEPVLALGAMSGSQRTRVSLGHALGAPISKGDSAVESRRMDRARAALDPLCQQLCAAGLDASVAIRSGKDAAVVAALVQELQPDVTVAGHTGVRGLDRFLIGSTARNLVRGTPVPTLVIGERPFDRIDDVLCALPPDLDGPDPAVHLAARFARATGARLTFLSATDQPDGALAARLHTAVSDQLGGPLDPGWRVRLVRSAKPATAILAASVMVDVVVMNTAGRSGLNRLLGGSVAESVVKSCPASVLVAR